MEIHEVRTEVEKELEDGKTFIELLRKFPNLFKDELDELFNDSEGNDVLDRTDKFFFQSESHSLKLIGEPIISEISPRGPFGQYEYSYISDFGFNGVLERVGTNNTVTVSIEGVIDLSIRDKSCFSKIAGNEVSFVEVSVINTSDRSSYEIRRKDKKV